MVKTELFVDYFKGCCRHS